MDKDFGELFYVTTRLTYGDAPVLLRGLTPNSVKYNKELDSVLLFDKIVDVSDIDFLLGIHKQAEVFGRLWDILGMSELPKISPKHYKENGLPEWTKEI